MMAKPALWLLLLYSVSTLADTTPSLSPSVRMQLAEVQQQLDEQRYDSAMQLLAMLAAKRLDAYEAARVYQTMGYVANMRDEPAAAADYFIQALALAALPKPVQNDLTYATVQLLVHTGQFKKSIHYLSNWLNNNPLAGAEDFILAATIYYQLGDYQSLIDYVEKACALVSEPPLNWYQMLVTAYLETQRYRQALPVVEKMIARVPDEVGHWLQLARLYQLLNQQQQALAIYELAYTKNLLDAEQRLQLAQYYLYLGLPYQGAVLLEKQIAAGGIDNNQKTLLLLADSWLLAKEHARAKLVLQTIINQFNDGKTRIRLAQLYSQAEEWSLVIETLTDNAALFKTQWQQADADLLIGIAQYHRDDISAAVATFTRILETDAKHQAAAQQWLEYLLAQS